MATADNGYSPFDPALLRHAAARFVKLVVRARWKAEPGFLDPAGLAAWGLEGIARDLAPAYALVQQAADALEGISVYLPACASGGVPADWDCSTPLGRVQDGIIGFVKYDCASTDVGKPFRDTASRLKEAKPVDWAALADWALLPALRGDLDRLPQHTDKSVAMGRLERIEARLEALTARSKVQEFYSTEEFAGLVDKSEFTVREYCRLGRIRAEKKRTGRGMHKSWVIAHEELERFRHEGLLPESRRQRA